MRLEPAPRDPYSAHIPAELRHCHFRRVSPEARWGELDFVWTTPHPLAPTFSLDIAFNTADRTGQETAHFLLVTGRMPPAKRTALEDSRSEASTIRERQIAAAAHARSKKQGASAATVNNGSALKELALVSTESGNVVVPGQTTGVSLLPSRPKILSRPRSCHWIPPDAVEYC